MKKYENVSVKVISLCVSDVITASSESTKNEYDELIEWNTMNQNELIR